MAKLAVVACARLAGLIDQPPEMASPKNPVIEESLAAMITPYIVHKMGNILFIIFHDYFTTNLEPWYLKAFFCLARYCIWWFLTSSWDRQLKFSANIWLRILWKPHKFWSHFDNFYFHYRIGKEKKTKTENQYIM